MTTNVHDITSASKRKLSFKNPIVRNTALVATGVVATVGVIAVLKKAPVLDVAATVENVKKA